LSAPDRHLPDAILGGAQKSGTTALHRLLEAHPQIFVPARPQEIHYFDLEENYRRGQPWLSAFFAARGAEPVAFQTSPLYLYEPAAPGRIAAALPEARLLFILRNPVDRAYSHYWHEVRYGWEPLPFEAALAREPERLAGGFEARRHFSYLDRGRYATQLRRYFDHFPPERILVLQSEDLERRPEWVARRAAAFLGVDPEAWERARPAARSRVNRAMIPRLPALQRLTRPLRPRWPRLAYLVDLVNLSPAPYPPLPQAIRRRLTLELAPEIEATARLAGLELSAWLEAGREQRA
jgi:hypothetical protein